MNMEMHIQDKEKAYRKIEWFIHAVAWGIVFIIPFFSSGRNREVVAIEDYALFVVGPLSFMVVFYVNYLFLIPRYLFEKQTGRFFLFNLLLISATVLVTHQIMQLLPPPDKFHHMPRWKPDALDVALFLLRNAAMYVLIAGLSVAIRMTARWYEQEATRKELDRSRVEAELRNLKSQLNPHFLFNTLNNIYSLIAFSPERAQEAVHDLSRLLRYVLYDSNQPFVPIEKELDFIRNYVELMRIRLPESARLEMNIDVQQSGLTIAPLLFISLIENAFKHGISNSNPSYIRIQLKENEDGIDCYIENSLFPKDAADQSGSGIGLTNLKKRLGLIYPENHLLVCHQENNAYIAELYIRIKHEDKIDL